MKQPIIAASASTIRASSRSAELGTEGVLTGSDFFAANPEPRVAAWVSDYEKRYNQKPSNASAEMYDTLYLMRECIKSTGVDGGNVKADRVKLRDCWSNMKNRSAANGRDQHR